MFSAVSLDFSVGMRVSEPATAKSSRLRRLSATVHNSRLRNVPKSKEGANFATWVRRESDKGRFRAIT